jgi:hypothetical protein
MGIRDYLDDKAPIPGFLNRNGEEPPRPIPSLEQQKYIPGRQKADRPPRRSNWHALVWRTVIWRPGR